MQQFQFNFNSDSCFILHVLLSFELKLHTGPVRPVILLTSVKLVTNEITMAYLHVILSYILITAPPTHHQYYITFVIWVIK
jgi:hypothetical protein